MIEAVELETLIMITLGLDALVFVAVVVLWVIEFWRKR